MRAGPDGPLARITAASSSELQPGGLQLAILVVCVDRLVAAAKARLLEAAEWRREVALAEAVYRDRARTDTRRNLMRTVHVIGPQRSRQSVAGVVRDADGVFHVLVFDKAHDRPEHLFARDGHIRRDLIEDRRLDEP